MQGPGVATYYILPPTCRLLRGKARLLTFSDVMDLHVVANRTALTGPGGVQVRQYWLHRLGTGQPGQGQEVCRSNSTGCTG